MLIPRFSRAHSKSIFVAAALGAFLVGSQRPSPSLGANTLMRSLSRLPSRVSASQVSRILAPPASDQEFRARLKSDSSFAAAVAEVDNNFLASTSPEATDLKQLLKDRGLQKPSQLNYDMVYHLNKKTNATSLTSRTLLKPANVTLEGQTILALPGAATPPKSSYGGPNTNSPVVNDQGTGKASPNSYLYEIGNEYWIDPPNFSDTYIHGHAWVGAICPPDYLWGIIPIGGCAVAHGGLFNTPRFGVVASYNGYNIGWDYASRQDDVSVLNVGRTNYYFVGIDEWLSTDDAVFEGIYVSFRPFG